MNYSDQALRVLSQAQEQASSFKHHFGSEHILLCLLSQDTNIAMEVLFDHGLSLEKVQQSVSAIPKTDDEELSMAASCKQLLIKAKDLARSTSSTEIDTEHLLLALLEIEGGGKKLLEDAGIKSDVVRSALLKRTQKEKSPNATGGKTVNVSQSGDPISRRNFLLGGAVILLIAVIATFLRLP